MLVVPKSKINCCSSRQQGNILKQDKVNALENFSGIITVQRQRQYFHKFNEESYLKKSNRFSPFTKKNRLNSVQNASTITTPHCYNGLNPLNTKRITCSYYSTKNKTTSSKSTPKNKGTQKNVEEIYQRKSPIEHVLLRPDTYVGTTERTTNTEWVVNGIEDGRLENARIEQQEVTYVPALFKIIDELLVNAVDNHHREEMGTTTLSVDIDPLNGWVHVANNGRNIPVKIHSQENMYVPELVFGHLMTGSNFDDDEVKYTGGRNGFGAKLANIFAQQFSVEIHDAQEQLSYQQSWKQNMSEKNEPQINPSSKQDSIRVSVLPDFRKFSMNPENKLKDNDIVSLIKRRVFDIAACNPRLQVFLNGDEVPINSFFEYVSLCFPSSDSSSVPNDDIDNDEENNGDPLSEEQQQQQQQNKTPFIYRRLNEHWEIAVGVSPEGQFSSVSFVNSIATPRGGSHVKYIADNIVKKIIAQMNESGQLKSLRIQPAHVRNQLAVFVNSLIKNPSFDSQTKERLTTKSSQFADQASVPDDFIAQVLNETTMSETVANYAMFKVQAAASKMRRPKLKGIPKLEDAQWAGTKKGSECTLIITEGDSAKALAVAGLSVIGREKFGVFPLKGKLLNVRDATERQLHENAEFVNLKRILGLDPNLTYETEEELQSLRYGKVMLMCDQDHDGSHIKGLFLNMIHTFWPNLLRRGYVDEFVTPIVKVTFKQIQSNQKNKTQRKEFFTVPEYEEWRRQNLELEEEEEEDQEKEKETTSSSLPSSTKSNIKPKPSIITSSVSVKYYKGLGTSTAAEGKQYFQALSKHRIEFDWDGDDAGKLMEMAFAKANADQRKDWLRNLRDGTHVDHSQGSIPVSEFINKELALFSQADTVRSIPSVLDGLKPGQRKVLYACFKKRLQSTEIKVAQLAGYVAEHTAYHHGEMALHNTIVGMAQDYVGSNNIPLLQPIGQFGTRLQGGKDAASARYIFTQLSDVARKVFPEADDRVLEHREDDGYPIEPVTYAPVIPMVLVNGAEGLGTGWSTSVPCYNPLDIIDNIERYLDGGEEPMQDMHPWYRGFTGDIEADRQRSGQYTSRGVIELKPNQQADITELPIRKWTEDYKLFLDSVSSEGGASTTTTNARGRRSKKIKPMLRKYSEHHTERSVLFKLKFHRTVNPSTLKKDSDALYKRLKLETSIHTTNMHLFDPEGQIKHYSSPLEIIRDFCRVRLQVYRKRKSYLIQQLQNELELLRSKSRFLRMVVNKELDLTSRRKDELEAQLESFGFPKLLSSSSSSSSSSNLSKNRSFAYLLNIPLFSLTTDNLSAILKECDKKEQSLQDLESTTPETLWREDLEALRKSLIKNKLTK